MGGFCSNGLYKNDDINITIMTMMMMIITVNSKKKNFMFRIVNLITDILNCMFR